MNGHGGAELRVLARSLAVKGKEVGAIALVWVPVHICPPVPAVQYHF